MLLRISIHNAAEQTDAAEPEQAGWFCLQVNSRPADPKRYAANSNMDGNAK